ncbi:MAG: 4-amino-4-deoxy-L-arabinose transferase [Betaproteobacteria bacterium]|nr:4-amino-4-deoxy-L-arabinose transferase [Betaproteobacteria bacterium]
MGDKNPLHGLTPALALALAFTIVLDTLAQLLWKHAVEGLPDNAPLQTTLLAVFSQPWFAVVIGLFLVQLWNWLGVLKHADLSFAQPITSISYLTVSVASWWLFGEAIGPVKTTGILLILAGVWLTSQGPRSTQADSEPPR